MNRALMKKGLRRCDSNGDMNRYPPMNRALMKKGLRRSYDDLYMDRYPPMNRALMKKGLRPVHWTPPLFELSL